MRSPFGKVAHGALRRAATRLAMVCWLAAAPSGLLLAAGAEQAVARESDPALEARVMSVAEELRCLVCQNETIAGSQSGLAIDLRRQIREQLAQGRSQAQILDFMVERYGEFVRFRPAFAPATALLWLGPFVLLALTAFALAANIRRRRRDPKPGPLSEAQARRVQQLLDEGAGAAR